MSAAAAGGPVLVASNRGPLSFTRGPDGQLTARRGGGGMVSGLLAAASQADLLWVCAALSDADREAARAAPGGRLPLDGAGPGRSAALMLDIPAPTFTRAYNGIANSTLWFIHHLLYDLPSQPSFGPSFWEEWSAYTDYNRAFAAALADAAGEGGQPRALVQDYHLALAPRMLAELRPGLRIAHFSHTP
jgi:trehalose 6-phosphate synthase